MATYQNEDRMGHLRTTVQIEPGERVALCRCFHSKNFPFCDGTHKQHPGKGPVIVEALEEPLSVTLEEASE
ncbi:MAG: CDGSH iron-sulfur domain-containing protein [Fimbriimonadales bacterium]|nr:CDGSH iron-sulfur domain-containing protein [Fimbriimonadales bacterium]